MMTLLPDQTDNLYFALLPDPDATEPMEKLAQEFRHQFVLFGSQTPFERLHVTLRNVGGYNGLPNDIVTAAGSAGAAVEADGMAPFEITFDQRMSFKGKPNPLVLTCSQIPPSLMTLRERLGEALRQAGLRAGTQSARFTPHITLLRDSQAVPAAPLESPISWIVREFVLIHSARRKPHDYPGRWQLHA